MILLLEIKKEVKNMNKITFHHELVKRLSKTFPDVEIQNAVNYYEEIIDERVEHGETEEDVVASFGEMQTIVSKITAEIVVNRSNSKSVKDAWRNFFIILAICSSPVLVPVAIAFVAVLVGLAVTFVSVIFALVVAAGAILISLIPIMIGLFATGAGVPEIMIGIGAALIVLGLLTVVIIKCYQIGAWVFIKISALFTEIVSKKTKGEPYVK
jgi:uncharacterized membrane protein